MSSCEKFIQAGGFSKANNLDLFLDCVLEASKGGPGHRGTGGLLVVAILFFAIVHRAYRQALVSGAPNGTPLRAVWMWDDIDIAQAPGSFLSSQVIANPGPYLAWAQERGIFQTWIDVNNAVDNPNAVSKFLSLSKAQGLSTQFVFISTGNKSDDFLSSGLYRLGEIFKLLKNIDKSLWPTAFQTDIEGLEGGDNADKFFQAHKKFKMVLDGFNKMWGTQIGLVASVLYWWIKFETEGNPPKVSNDDCGRALLKIGCDVTVQDYRPPKNPPALSWIVNPAKAWCELASSFQRQAWIGLLVGPSNPTAFDYKSDIGSLDPDLASVAGACVDISGFAGMAVHDAYYYQKAAP